MAPAPPDAAVDGGPFASGRSPQATPAFGYDAVADRLDAIRCSLPPESRGLDFGCGTAGSRVDVPGYPTLLSYFNGTTWFGYEPAEPSPHPPFELVTGPLPLPWANHSFDLIACIDVLEHVADIDATLAELNRLLAASGTLLVSVPEGRSLSDALYRLWGRLRAQRTDHVRAWTKTEWIATIAQATGTRVVGLIHKDENYHWLEHDIGKGELVRRLGRASRAGRAWAMRHGLDPAPFIYGYLLVFVRV
jgi:SAM-dependent methyltransferase